MGAPPAKRPPRVGRGPVTFEVSVLGSRKDDPTRLVKGQHLSDVGLGLGVSRVDVGKGLAIGGNLLSEGRRPI